MPHLETMISEDHALLVELVVQPRFVLDCSLPTFLQESHVLPPPLRVCRKQ